jgi:hypothetical protein
MITLKILNERLVDLVEHIQKMYQSTQVQNDILETKEAIEELEALQPKNVYVLLADGDGTMRSIDTPFGVAVTSETEAKRYVLEKGIGYTHSYEKLAVFDNKDDAIKFIYPRYALKDKR